MNYIKLLLKVDTCTLCNYFYLTKKLHVGCPSDIYLHVNSSAELVHYMYLKGQCRHTQGMESER